MPILLSVKKSSNPKKKWTALFRMPNTKDGKEKFKSVSFGSPNMEDFLAHKDLQRRSNYLSRHKSDLRTNDPLRPGFLAYYITWSGFNQKGKPTTSIPKLIRMYNKKFFKK
tara:strand:- start:3047 stop:3379 length:333 start_codon:yes stop_codon:yes gene_type:complete